jgi:thioredoxin 1
MAAELAISSANFGEKVLESEVPVLVDFWAPWCGPCRAIAPAIDELAGEYAGKAGVFKLDIDANPEVANEYGVMSIPAFIVFKGGQEFDRVIGVSPGAKQQLADMINRAM